MVKLKCEADGRGFSYGCFAGVTSTELFAKLSPAHLAKLGAKVSC